MRLGKRLRTHLLLELIHLVWNKTFASGETFRVRLVSIFYGKALAFTELGLVVQALETLKQINSLKALGKGWAIYTKLLDLTEMLQNKVLRQGQPGKPEAQTHQQQQKRGGLISSIASGISGLFIHPKTKPEKSPQPLTAAAPESKQGFYFDPKTRKWIINGKEADSEYDMGQEPILPKQKGEVPPPPSPAASKGVPVIVPAPAAPKEKEKAKPEEVAKIADPFQYKPAAKPETATTTKAGHQPKYVSQ